MKNPLREPFWQAILILVAAYLLIKFGIPYIPPLIGVRSAPVPQSVIVQYMLTVAVGVLIWVSADETRWKRFKAPVLAALVQPEKRLVRIGLLVTVPLFVGFLTYDQVRPTVSAPATLRSIHPAPPTQITYRGEVVVLDHLENPLRQQGDLEEHIALGKRLYYQNCMACHGDALDGRGHYAHGFSPAPLEFGGSTIAQLTESFVFWRIAKGGPGLPREGHPWASAMPAWEEILTQEEVWATIIFLYDQAGLSPRTWEEF